MVRRHALALLVCFLALSACREAPSPAVLDVGKTYVFNLAPERVAFDGRSPVDLRAPAPLPLRLERRYTLAEQRTRRALVQGDPRPVVFRGVVPDQGRLTFGLAFALRGADEPRSFLMEVAVRSPDGGREVVFSEQVTRPMGKEESRWWDREVALTGPAGADLELTTRLPDGAGRPFGDGDIPAWGNPVITRAPRPLEQPSSPPRSVVVVMVDTLRRDHLGTYGYRPGVSPRIDALTPECVVFDTARSVTSWTMPTVASLFTASLPSQHGAQRYSDRLDADPTTLAEVFSDAGWQTAAIGASEWVFNPTFGLDRGFDESLYVVDGHALEHVPAGAVIDETLAWLDDHSDEPFLLYVHLTDPHAPYTPQQGWDRFGDPDYAGQINGHNLGDDSFLERDAESVSAADLDRLRSLYDAEIAYTDNQIGRLIDRLRALDLWDTTTFALTSDHGEEFLDHGGWTHGATLYEEQLAVPLLLKPPQGSGMTPYREVRTVSLMHLGQALCDLAGVPVPAGPFSHGDLLPKLRGDPGGLDDQIVAELAKPGFAAWSVRRRVVKYVRTFEPEESTRVFLVDVDPGERQDLLSHLDDATQAELERRALEWRRRVLEAATGDGAGLDAEAERQLRSLGYLEGR